MIGPLFAMALAMTSPPPLGGDALSMPAPERVLAIPPSLRDQLRTQVLSQTQSPQRRAQLLVDFIFRADGLGIQYNEDSTFTVEQAVRARTANCLTFTLLTVALAREAGLEAYGQQIAKSLAWRQQGGTLYRAIHVNAGLRVGQRRMTIDVASDRVIAGDPPQRISDARLLAHFYNNRSVALMAAGQLEAAAQYAERSLQLDPDYATSWSNAGVVHLRAGHTEQAERDYRNALSLDPMNAGALINLGAHYRRIGTPELAAPLALRLDALQQSDPLHQFIVGLDLERRGDLRQAVVHYQQAIRLFGREYRFYTALARAYTSLGDQRRANRALRRARQLQ